MEMTLTLLTRTLRDSVGALRAAEFVEAFESALASSSAMTVDVSELPCAQAGSGTSEDPPRRPTVNVRLAGPAMPILTIVDSTLKHRARADR
jgi:hypothetical protein